MIELTIGIKEVALFLLGSALGGFVGAFVNDLIWGKND